VNLILDRRLVVNVNTLNILVFVSLPCDVTVGLLSAQELEYGIAHIG
jgi:hypothetical protein